MGKNISVEKIASIVIGIVVVVALLFMFVFTETVDYFSAVNENSVPTYVAFRTQYPESSRLPKVKEKMKPLEAKYFEKKRTNNTLRAYEEFLRAYPDGVYTAEATRLRDSILQIELDIEKYGNNVLEQGTLPYEKYYGANQVAKTKFNADIDVTAPIAFDVVAVVRKENELGDVVAHAYIRADSTYTFRVDNGKYQVFFYIGKGWKPTKKMENGVEGGFVRNETFSKDDPVSLANEVITYRVSMVQKNRRFKQSTRSEVLRK